MKHRIERTAFGDRVSLQNQIENLIFATLFPVGANFMNDICDRLHRVFFPFHFDGDALHVVDLLVSTAFDDARIRRRMHDPFVIRTNPAPRDLRVQFMPVRLELFDLRLDDISFRKEFIVQPTTLFGVNSDPVQDRRSFVSIRAHESFPSIRYRYRITFSVRMMRFVRFDFVAVRFNGRHNGGDEEHEEDERRVRRSIVPMGMIVHLFISN